MARVTCQGETFVSVFYLGLVAADAELMKGHRVRGSSGLIQRRMANRALLGGLTTCRRMVTVPAGRFGAPGAPVVHMNKGNGARRAIIRGQIGRIRPAGSLGSDGEVRPVDRQQEKG